NPAVAMDADGDFAIVWNGSGPGDGAGIFAQRYEAAGMAEGGEFRVNTYTSSIQYVPAVAMDTHGDFVVAWVSNQDGGSGTAGGNGIYAQRYDAAGTAQGTEFRVNDFTTGSQFFPRVAADADGDFVVTWTSPSQDGNGDGIFARRFTNAGLAQGTE